MHEKAEHDKCSSKAGFKHKVSVLKMGPCGGARDDNWDMDVGSVDRIVKVVVWRGGIVYAMSWHIPRSV
jgi:hypothetical protein